MSKAGFDRAYLDSALLPDWWDKSCDRDAALVPDIEIRVARFLGLSLGEIQTASALTAPAYPNARLKRTVREGVRSPGPAIHAALRTAGAVLRSLKAPLPPVSLPPAAPEWRELLSKQGGSTLASVVGDLWRRGIPVIHLGVLPSPKFQGLACLVDGRPVIVLGHDTDIPSRLLADVAHEVGHLFNGDCQEGAPVVDEDYEATDRSEMEVAADRYAVEAVLGTAPPATPTGEIWGDFKAVASLAVKSAEQHALDVDSLIWFWASRARKFDVGNMALKAVYGVRGGKKLLRAQFDEHVALEAASDTDRALLRCVTGDPASATAV